MAKHLVIVESPAKAKTIGKFLGKDYVVKSSFGHVRDLSKKDFGVEMDNGFKPMYEISADKKKLIAELKKDAKKVDIVWLASDEDREGEAIAWHLFEALELKAEHTRRIVFHEITKTAILNAIDNPREIDINLVEAQQARRVLDRLVGYEISPVLWRKVKPSLSAGRVQSVAVRLIVEKETDIKAFTSTSSYRVVAQFFTQEDSQTIVNADLTKRFEAKAEAEAFLQKCVGANYQVSAIEKKPTKRSPAPPFTTSTLQQEAGRKLGFGVSRTMIIAQQLYEAGHITYMRTDSVNLSNLAIGKAKEVITQKYGAEYSKTRQFNTKSKGAQEAHEAIRPTFLEHENISGDANQKRLYSLIWKRTMASQMAEAKLEKTNIDISVSTATEQLRAQGEVIVFDGFLKLYVASTDEGDKDTGGVLPPLKQHQALFLDTMTATERFTNPPARYSEPALVRKMEELGIGRPSTYAPTITTIQKRGYVIKDNVPGVKRNYAEITLSKDKIKESTKSENAGAIKNKLVPTDIGILVNKFLTEHFETVMDYNFTAKVEKEFDAIAAGKKAWNKMIGQFYTPFKEQIDHTIENAEREKGERVLGTDPETGKTVSARIGRFGSIIQIGQVEDDEKPRFAGLKKGQSIATITFEEAMELFRYPRKLGELDGKVVNVAIGRFGPYVSHNNLFASIPKGEELDSIDFDRAIELLEEKKKKEAERHIKSFDEDPDLQILKGKWGPYIKYKKKNFKLPKAIEAATLELTDCMQLIEEQGGLEAKKKNTTFRKTSTRKTAEGKASTKKKS